MTKHIVNIQYLHSNLWMDHRRIRGDNDMYDDDFRYDILHLIRMD